MEILCKIFKNKVFFIMFGLLFLVACSGETSTSTEQSIALNEISQDANADIFILNASVYKKVRDIKNEEVDIDDYSNIGKITKHYSEGEPFTRNMSTVLPNGTEIFRHKEDSQMVVAKTPNGYTLYESIPEG